MRTTPHARSACRPPALPLIGDLNCNAQPTVQTESGLVSSSELTLPPAAYVAVCRIDGIELNLSAQPAAFMASRLTLRCSDPLLTMSGFCPTSTWELLIAFPRTQSLRVEARESGRREAGSAVLIDLEIRPGSLNAYRVGLWQSLVATGSVNSASELARMGLPRAEICSIVEFRPAATPEEFAAVLAMRTKAYRRAHKYTGEGPMTDRFDPRAIIICAFIGPRPIASLRLMAHGEGEEWEHDRFIQWPADFPARAQCVEASRMCVDPDFQRVAEALFTGILRRAVVVVLALKRRYVLGCATDALLPLYRKTGCVVIPVRFTHTDLGPKAHTLILADINSRVRGNGLAFTTWLLKWSDTARWVSRIGLIKSRGPIQKVGASVAAGVAALLAPFARRILRNVG